jgi:hypothetical protein
MIILLVYILVFEKYIKGIDLFNTLCKHIGRDLDNISRGLTRPEVPLQAPKLKSEAGIILRNHVPIFTHWKHYMDIANTAIVQNFNDKVSVSNCCEIDSCGLWIYVV